MADWIYDEDIDKTTVSLFTNAGITGKHIKWDLQKGGSEDDQVLSIAKKEKATLITANGSDFKKIPNSDYNNSYGVFMLNTNDPKERVKLFQKAIVATGLDTLKKRKEKKVNVKRDAADVIDTRTNMTKTHPYIKKKKSS